MEQTRKRLGIFVGQADEGTQSRFITGFTQHAFEQDTDVCVFSMYKKSQDTPEREKGETNIFALANPELFDGFVIMEDTIQTAGIGKQLEERLHKEYDGPVLVVDANSEYYPSIFMNGYSSVRMLTEHVINVHGITDIAFLNGKKWHRHSKQRLSGFMDEMEAHGLKVPEYRIIEGDFWYKSGERCVDYLLADEHPLPKALICANDQMAIGVCKALAEKDIHVPEDMIVIGADSCFEGQTSPKSITSYLTPEKEFGAYAFECLCDIADKKEIRPFTAQAQLLIGESCGCEDINMPSFSLKRDDWDTQISMEGVSSVNNTMFENLMKQTDIRDYISTVYSYAFQIGDVASFNLCLVDNIGEMGSLEPAFFAGEGYPEKMIYAIRYNSNRIANMAGMDATFETKRMLPDLYKKRAYPAVFFFTPVYSEDRNFGYSVISYTGRVGVYDELYRRWIAAVSNGLESLRRYLTISELRERMNKIKSGKFEVTASAYENLSPEEKQEYNLVKKILDKNLLTYHFQPIVSAVDGSIFSYEALMRSNSEKRISPLTIIKYAAMMNRLADVESATFVNVMDILDENEGALEAKVFINSIPGVKIDNREKILERLSKRSDTVVVELTEEAELGEDQLIVLKEFFQRINIEIAVDDYGTGYSNISNLLRYMPDYVKIDRSLLSDIHNRPQKQHFVREIIEFCHDNNIKALAEGVETAEELRKVIHLGADLIQGYYTAKPASGFLSGIDERIIEEIKIYQQEKKDGKSQKAYIAGKTNRIALLNLIKEGYTDIVIGHGEMVYKDITIVGMPSMKSDIHLRVEQGYTGRITLENVYFSNVKDRPCIDLGEYSDVVCVLAGDNTLNGSGVRVPDSARFSLEGEGNLQIVVNNGDYYGLGNDSGSEHGELLIGLSGRLNVDGRGTRGICIGSGKGGPILIDGGSILLKSNGDTGVGIGSLSGSHEIKVHSCGLEIDMSVSKGVGIGSLSGDPKVHIQKSFIKTLINGNLVSGVGTCEGERTDVDIADSLTEISIRSGDSTCIGAINGELSLKIRIATIRIDSAGERALAIGGVEKDVEGDIDGADIRITLYNSFGIETYAKEENMNMINTRCSILVNDNVIERKVVYKYD